MPSDTSPYGGFMAPLDLRTEVSDDTAVSTMPRTDGVSNTRGGLLGGLVATLVDTAAGVLITRSLPPDKTAATADLNLHFLRPVSVGPARAVATLVRQGRTTAVVRVDVFDDGRDVLAAIATLTFSILTFRPDQGDPGRPRTVAI